MREVSKNNIITEVDYINKILRGKKRGFKKIALEDYGMSDIELLAVLERLGYAKVKNKVVVQEEVQGVVQGVVQGAVQEEVQEREVKTNSLININSYLKENTNILIEMIEQYKKNSVVPKGDIVVQLPYEDDKAYKISMRVNKTVMERFKAFCENHKNFTQKELISMALLEYMDNHL